MTRISVVTPFYGPNSPALLPDYIGAVRGAEVIAVDNGSPAEAREAIRQAAADHGWFHLINDHNAGFAGGNTQGYKAASGDVIVFLNSDVAAPPAFLRAVAADVRDGALYGPALAHQLVYGMWVPYLEGWCVAATRATWERINAGSGPWDAEAYPGPYWEDNDLCLRAAQAGISLVHTQWPVHHKGGQSAGALIKWGDVFERNRATFAARVRAVWESQREAAR